MKRIKSRVRARDLEGTIKKGVDVAEQSVFSLDEARPDKD
jgi:hypothetical protein